MTTLTLLYIFVSFAFFFFIRVDVIYRLTYKRIHEIHRENLVAIDQGDYHPLMSDRYSQVNFLSMLWQLDKWTYRQFFGSKSQ